MCPARRSGRPRSAWSRRLQDRDDQPSGVGNGQQELGDQDQSGGGRRAARAARSASSCLADRPSRCRACPRPSARPRQWPSQRRPQGRRSSPAPRHRRVAEERCSSRIHAGHQRAARLDRHPVRPAVSVTSRSGQTEPGPAISCCRARPTSDVTTSPWPGPGRRRPDRPRVPPARFPVSRSPRTPLVDHIEPAQQTSTPPRHPPRRRRHPPHPARRRPTAATAPGSWSGRLLPRPAWSNGR